MCFAMGSWSWFFLFLVVSVASRQTVLDEQIYWVGLSMAEAMWLGGVILSLGYIIDFGYLFEDGSPCLLHRLASWSSPVNGFAGAMVR